MSDLNFNKPIILVPTIIIGIGVLGAIAYGIKSKMSGSGEDAQSVYSSDNESVRSPSLDSNESVESNGAEFRNASFSSEDSTGGSRKNKKIKRKGKKSKKSKSKSKSKSR